MIYSIQTEDLMATNITMEHFNWALRKHEDINKYAINHN